MLDTANPSAKPASKRFHPHFNFTYIAQRHLTIKGLGVSVQPAAVLQSRAAAGQASALSPVMLLTAALTACREQQCLQHLGLAGRNGEFTSATRIAHIPGPTVQRRAGSEEPGSQVLLPIPTTPVPLPGAGNAADIFGTTFKAQLNQLQLKTS